MGEQACISRQARGGVWGVLTYLFVRHLVSLGYPWFPFVSLGNGTWYRNVSFRPAAHFRGCLNACSWSCLFVPGITKHSLSLTDPTEAELQRTLQQQQAETARGHADDGRFPLPVGVLWPTVPVRRAGAQWSRQIQCGFATAADPE